jgi:hypothetical protein
VNSKTHLVIPAWFCTVASGILALFVPWLAWISYNVVEMKTNYAHCARSHQSLQVKVDRHAYLLARLSKEPVE